VESIAQYLVRLKPQQQHFSSSVGVENSRFGPFKQQVSTAICCLPMERENAVIEAVVPANRNRHFPTQMSTLDYSCFSSSFVVAPSSSIKRYLFNRDDGPKHFSSGPLMGLNSVGAVLGSDPTSSSGDNATDIQEIGFAIGANQPLSEVSSFIPLIRSSLCRQITRMYYGDSVGQRFISEMDATQVLQMYQQSLSDTRTRKIVQYLIKAAKELESDNTLNDPSSGESLSSVKKSVLVLYDRLRSLDILMG